MLDNETKRRIDTARDILVGRIPDPKAQVEQITIALIYKFMDDMDAEAEELGGKRKFFSGKYARYGWQKLMSPKLGGFEVLTLYSEAIQQMNYNQNIPQLFRDIFKNAYLPYRDPETLKSFLKIINDFSYDHSERLGDAFEYLLSVLGSQGDAGQFRTPRHIIDFMVYLIDPKKNETILDPACGTAGFLISSYKHIVKNNSSSYKAKNDTSFSFGNGDSYKGDKLTPDDRKRMAGNLKGFDISPDMVRLSLVNLYLHGFTDPKIYEYDTLTSEERWNEYADIIMANPPFMSPKGGIKPHKRFSVECSRSEVLFVDYIAEHLTPKGRAAVIVPEGIIFQSGTAYKALRKMLVEKYLYAVVSLPAGVFNPYSGVKTSILLMDKTLAKKTDKILFAKVENDGFDLGAQRRANTKGELPDIALAIREYVKAVNIGAEFNVDVNTNLVITTKEKIGENDDWNLSGERYKLRQIRDTQYEIVELGTVVEILDSFRKPITQNERKSGIYPYYGATGILDYVEDYLFNEPLVLVGEDGAKWLSGEKTAFLAEGKYWVNNHAHVIRPIKEKLLQRYLIELLNEMDLSQYITGVTVPKLNQAKLRSIPIPLPPLEVQKEIVAEIEGWQKIIDGARQVIENYKPQIDIDPSWEQVELKEVCDVRDGTHDSPQYYEKGIPFLTQKNITRDGLSFTDIKYISKSDHDKFYKRSNVASGDIIISMIGANRGMSCIVDDNRAFSIKNVGLIKLGKNINQKFLLYYLKSEFALNYVKQVSKGGAQEFIGLTALRAFPIHLPSKKEQVRIVNEIETEFEIINADKRLIEIFVQKIKVKIAKVWGE